MKVILAKHAGFCKGVTQAVKLAYQKREEGAEVVYTDGPLIHNKQMIDQMASAKIKEVNSDVELENLAKQPNVQNVSLLIRAHGITPERRQFLISLNIPLCDATCPDVAKIAGQIKIHAKKGYHVLIFGDSKHPEVVGLMGYTEGKVTVVSCLQDCKMAVKNGEKVCLVSQSTMFVDDFDSLAEELKKICSDVVICNTICEATRQRQHDISELKQEGAEAIIVVGGKHSANTKKLVLLSQKYLPTIAIETADELNLSSLRQYQCVGVTAGASTPEFIIDAVIKKINLIDS